MKLRILVVSLIFGMAAFAADTGAELFQKAVTQERAAGNLEEAIKLYQRVATEYASDRALAAKALVQEARCYEKLGQGKAVKLYEQVARDYRDQREPVAMANARLVVLRQGEHVPAPATITQRRIELPGVNTDYYTYLETDGQRRVFSDGTTGALMIGDLANKEKRFIVKPKNRVVESFMLSRDFSLLLMHLIRPDGTASFALVRTDGTGYREIDGDWPGWCAPEFSWDNRSVLLCRREPGGTQPLLRVSVADGTIQKVREADGSGYRLSPDGRFMAYNEDHPFGNKILVMPSQGGEPKLVSEGATLADWTRDGRYLIIDRGSGRSAGPEALYLLPVNDGLGAGNPIFVRYGSFRMGRTMASGAFIYQATPREGQYTPWLGTLDANGPPLGWQRLNLSGSNAGPHYPTWSPDSTQFAYVAYNGAAGQATGSLHVRTVASGEERELYPDVAASCFWSAQHPNIFCNEHALVQKRMGALSISTETGRAERLGDMPEPGGAPLIRTRDDRAIYSASQQGLMRWEIGAPEWTVVEEGSGLGSNLTAKVSPDERWITRYGKSRYEIRLMAGGDWKPLISLPNINQIAFTPDGNWLVYHAVEAGKDGLFRVATTGGNPERLGDFPAVSTRGSMWISPDGQKIIADAFNPPELWMLENFEPRQ